MTFYHGFYMVFERMFSFYIRYYKHIWSNSCWISCGSEARQPSASSQPCTVGWRSRVHLEHVLCQLCSDVLFCSFLWAVCRWVAVYWASLFWLSWAILSCVLSFLFILYLFLSLSYSFYSVWLFHLESVCELLFDLITA